ncbi:1-pyrroline-5-carboxylate dehydrogenase [Cyphellophora europaea CBS 101466]|uniref:Multifunctional fusion protein n=1 Tax=Cyphellophora europaea (strain CBS 101466) TaxID=1220924 RepID=W2RSN9_CYPE1|nr:1-pyrroline-5-carboxylate dehydrogenase [Cyphellophora europaea CBS 101466]ETN39526.1 1-pyrroline-5-carboxylate dehydrogenase [Cyphellophora europaea CBS 101466]
MAFSSSSSLGSFNALPLSNEPFTTYGPNTSERELLKQALKDVEAGAPYEVFPNVNGCDETGDLSETQCSPFKHSLVLAKYSHGTPELVSKAIKGALEAKKSWCRTSLHDRAAICYRAVGLLRGPYRYRMLAATMLGQGKNAYQADIDCYAESIDFLQTFPALAEQLYKNQPPFNAPNVWNRTEARPLDGFVYAVTPFNFTALAVNLVMAPIIMGNVVIWKPSPGAIYSNYLFQQIMIEAGLPPGVLQFLPGDAELVTDVVLSSRELGGLHFTGSTAVFRSLSSKIGANMSFWRSYPRVVGETGGKNFHLLHPTADVKNAALKSVRAAFEYQGQKCSALSRIYVPESLAKEFKDIVAKEADAIKMGSAFTDFMGPVISRSAFNRVSQYIKEAKSDSVVNILAGGTFDDSEGFFIRPTVIETTDPKSKYMSEEIFGPFVCIYVYKDEDYGSGLFDLIESTTDYALTGAVFAKNRAAIIEATEGLRFAAGNFYINDQCTGAMPGQQPFGGSRASGTNDKAGTAGLLTRFMSQRTIKENFSSINNILYSSNLE